ncbi:MAG: hypothetical protein V2J07_05975, partial [Anaerolineae bacterium]|nr:hypothetical protein [Anaerolineae bacterium]
MSILKLHYASLEQRVAAAFYNGLAKIEPADASQKDLQLFFHTLYQALYENPEQFGFNLQPDDALIEGEENEKDHKQELNRKMKKSRTVIMLVLEMLIHLGAHGKMDGNELSMLKDDLVAKAFRSHNQKKFFAGMAALGFHLTDDGEQVSFYSEPTPHMLPALQALAQACAEHEEPRAGLFNFI